MNEVRQGMSRVNNHLVGRGVEQIQERLRNSPFALPTVVFGEQSLM